MADFSKLGMPDPPAPAGRTCAVEECGTVLSRYNTTMTCSLHDGWRFPSSEPTRGEQTKDVIDGDRRRALSDEVLDFFKIRD